MMRSVKFSRSQPEAKMKNKRLIYGLIFILAVIAGGCSVKKHIPEGEMLYVGANITLKPDTLAPKMDLNNLESELEGLVRPTPNKTLFGYPYKVGLYYFMGEPKKEKGFRNWFRKKLGEPPVFVTNRMISTNSDILKSHINNEGYFRSTVQGKLEPVKSYTTKALYEASVKQRYTINSYQYRLKDSTGFYKDLKETEAASYLKPGNPYRLEVIEAERSRIDATLKQKGYYYFSPDHLIVKVDSSLNNHKADLFLELKPTVLQTALKPYYIRDIYVFAESERISSDSTAGNTEIRRGIKIVDKTNSYRNFIFTDAIAFERGSLYNTEAHNTSLARLVNLKNFKFVKNQFELIPRSDSSMLDVYYYLTPQKKKFVQTELSGVTKSNNLAGVQFNVGWSNRNIFRAAEMLRISASIGKDVQIGGGSAANSNDFFRFSTEAELSFPRFIIPFYNPDPVYSRGLPRTSLTLGYESLNQIGLYTLTSIRGHWSYYWQKNTKWEHTLSPLGINLVRPGNISNEFIEKLFESENPLDFNRYLNILQNRLILESQYNFTFNPTRKRFSPHQFVISGGINLAGNIAGLFIKNKDPESDIHGQIFNIPYEQFSRFDGEIKYFYDVNRTVRWANRFLFGLGIPYGNSKTLPQIKQYFAGGSTGIRAFQARTVGPGAYYSTPEERASFGNNSYGDIRLEFNTEFRIKLSSLLQTAVFMDAGNIWEYRYSESSRFGEEAAFTSDFYKQIAVGGGVGLRLDFSYLVFRLDLAVPFRKPWYTIDEDKTTPWVFNEMNFGDKSWRKENLVLNIAVAFPF